MSKKSVFGHKMQKKSWDPLEIDREAEDKKMGFVFLGVVVVMILMGLLMWWIRQSLH